MLSCAVEQLSFNFLVKHLCCHKMLHRFVNSPKFLIVVISSYCTISISVVHLPQPFYMTDKVMRSGCTKCPKCVNQ